MATAPAPAPEPASATGGPSPFRSRAGFCLAALTALCGPLHGVGTSGDGPVDFAREVLPVLSDKCFVCHGPDSRKRNQLRLDSFAAATTDRGGYQAIDPADPEKSELLVRILDEDDPMPPADAERQLSASERELLARWVRQGGQYAKHWAFVPPRKVRSEAESARPAAARNPIDGFVLERLREKELGFAPAADRAALARRAALVLTGLPPEPERLYEFLADDDPDAYEHLLDELLASPHYGEHQARYWLDAVRYGDTHGLHLDNRRGIYPYRDWVVRAFNRNLPLDDFIVWQLAGDLLPNRTLEQHVATGFVRMNPSTSEGGVLPEEFQAKNNFDRTETLGTVFLGMTMTCARCHTHKYDPITHTDYYRLLAFFNSTAEKPLDGNAYVYAPVRKAPADHDAWREWSALETARDRLLARFEPEDEEQLSALADRGEATAKWTTDNWRIGRAVAEGAEAPPDQQPVPEDQGSGEEGSEAASVAKPVWEETEGLPGQLKRKLPKDGQAVWVSFRLEAPVDQVLWLTFSGGSGSRVEVDGSPLPAATRGSARSDQEGTPLAIRKGTHEVQLKMAGTGTEPGVSVEFRNPWEPLASKGRWDECDAEDRLFMLADPFGSLAGPGLQDEAFELAERIHQARAAFTTTLVAEELEEPRPTHLLNRGEYNLPVGDPLEPGVPSVMGALPANAPRNRLGLAQWLTAREHPLVARVLVNRIWQRVFGEGLVRTPEDFGVQGQQPTHPELLDWLAVELQESGWDMKHMLRLMVTSRTFRQQSVWRDQTEDPENRLLARGPSYRLDAEILRDLGLWASGLLDPRMGGEGVKPYQPSGLWFAMAHPASNTKRYVRDEGRKLYRRSLYVYWKRTSPHPMMTLFDAPSREVSCVRRSRTSTSLQSLGLLNETQRLEMSRVLAERLLRGASEDSARLDLLFVLLASRSPTEPETAACRELLQDLRVRYAAADEDARELLSVGEAARDESLDLGEHAAWTQLAVTVLASDAAITLY